MPKKSNLTSKPSRFTGKPLPRTAGPFKTVGDLRKELEKWPAKMPLSYYQGREKHGAFLTLTNVGDGSEYLGIEEFDDLMHDA